MGTIANKLTYLNTTKSDIKDVVNNLGGNITNATTFRNYATEISNMFNNYFDYLPNFTGVGSSFTFTPTIKNKIKIQLLGTWYQDGTPTPNNEVTIQYSQGNQTLSISDGSQNSQTEILQLKNYKLYNGDYFQKENGTWYLYNTKNEIIYTGSDSENWTWLTSKRTYYIPINDMLAQSIDLNDEGDFIRTNYYEYKGKSLWQDTTFVMTYGFLINNEYIHLRNQDILANHVADLKFWLSTHNLKVIYTLATPNKIEITDTDIISSLDNINNMHSYLGTTELSIQSEGLPIKADITVIQKA